MSRLTELKQKNEIKKKKTEIRAIIKEGLKKLETIRANKIKELKEIEIELRNLGAKIIIGKNNII